MNVKPTILTSILATLLSAGVGLAQEDDHDLENRNRTMSTRTILMRSIGRGYIGVQLTRLTPELRVHFGVPEDSGVMVSRVEEGGPAEAAGVRVGDIVTAVDGQRVDDGRRLSHGVRQKNEGESVALELYRDGGIESYLITIAERERSVIDLAGGYRFFPDGEYVPDHDVAIAGPGFRLDEHSMEAFERAMQEVETRFDSPEWQEKIERMKDTDFSAIQQRMQQVEKRLKELEAELDNETRQKF